jgi:hypothetical protein
VPSPKSQNHVDGTGVDVSVKETDNGTTPVVGVAEKFVMLAIGVLYPVSCIYQINPETVSRKKWPAKGHFLS